MALTVRLDAETERCLRELQAVIGLERSALIRELWRLRRPAPTITELLDSPQPAFLCTLPAGGYRSPQPAATGRAGPSPCSI
jgi:hypothetical protein